MDECTNCKFWHELTSDGDTGRCELGEIFTEPWFHCEEFKEEAVER